MIKITDTVKHLIIINVILFVASLIFKEQIYDLLAMHFVKNPTFKPWQILTHMFMHGGQMHLLFNMLGLWMFGSAVEQMLGRNNFLLLYFGAGIGAVLLNSGINYFQFHSVYTNLLHSGISSDAILKILNTGSFNDGILDVVSRKDVSMMFYKYNGSMVGASGALYGIMVAFGVLQPKAKMGLLFLPIMIEARIFIPLLLFADIFFGVFSVKGDNIAHFAHVGGAIFGFILIMYLKKNQFKN